MAVTTARTSVTTVAILLATNTSSDAAPNDYATRSIALKNATGTASIFLGPLGVTAATGFEWAPSDGSVSLDIEPGESIYGILAAAAATQLVHTIGLGR